MLVIANGRGRARADEQMHLCNAQHTPAFVTKTDDLLGLVTGFKRGRADG